ncbi:hypothetical protein TYRP_000801 [Tyrophagus putrescentiae]|nr:hypothetical protein TYRP_000801 [Tyrophagus putrescentiae]
MDEHLKAQLHQQNGALPLERSSDNLAVLLSCRAEQLEEAHLGTHRFGHGGQEQSLHLRSRRLVDLGRRRGHLCAHETDYFLFLLLLLIRVVRVVVLVLVDHHHFCGAVATQANRGVSLLGRLANQVQLARLFELIRGEHGRDEEGIPSRPDLRLVPLLVLHHLPAVGSGAGKRGGHALCSI